MEYEYLMSQTCLECLKDSKWSERSLCQSEITYEEAVLMNRLTKLSENQISYYLPVRN